MHTGNVHEHTAVQRQVLQQSVEDNNPRMGLGSLVSRAPASLPTRVGHALHAFESRCVCMCVCVCLQQYVAVGVRCPVCL